MWLQDPETDETHNEKKKETEWAMVWTDVTDVWISC